jgi:hypothetical protein
LRVSYFTLSQRHAHLVAPVVAALAGS